MASLFTFVGFWRVSLFLPRYTSFFLDLELMPFMLGVGRFQMVSLSEFAEVTEEGVLFNSPFDGKPTMLTVSLVPLLSISFGG